MFNITNTKSLSKCMESFSYT